MEAIFVQSCVHVNDKDLLNHYTKKGTWKKAGLEIRKAVLKEWNENSNPSCKLKLKDLTSWWIKCERMSYNGKLYCILTHSGIEHFYEILS